VIPVLISEAALRDVEEIWTFVSLESPGSATTLIRLLLERAFSLGEFPNAGSRVAGHPGTRRVMVRTWAIFYEVAPSQVEVVRIAHGGRDVTALRLRR
jgi:plasmid stabilization system protein ParE